MKNSSNPFKTLTGKKPQVFSYKSTHSFEKRQKESNTIQSKYPDRIPIICERSNMENDHSVPDIDKKKFLVPVDLSVGQFLFTIRRRIKLSPEKALFLFVGVHKKIVPTSELIGVVYDRHKDEDGFLYMVYSGENTFGL